MREATASLENGMRSKDARKPQVCRLGRPDEATPMTQHVLKQ